jgi:hypothetical protein
VSGIAQLTGTRDLAYGPAPTAMALDYLTIYGPDRAAFVVRHALGAAKAVDFPMQTFGGTQNFLPQALVMRNNCIVPHHTHDVEPAAPEFSPVPPSH